MDDRRVHRTLTLEQVFEAGRRAGMERPNIGLRSDETVDKCVFEEPPRSRVG